MTNLLQAGLSNSLVATLLAIVVVLVSRRLRHPAWTHALWVLVLLKLVTPPLFALPVLPSTTDQEGPRTRAVAVTVDRPIEDGPRPVAPEPETYEEELTPAAAVAVYEPSTPQTGDQSAIAEPSILASQTEATVDAAVLNSSVINRPSFISWICMIWIAGCVVRGLYIARRVVLFRRWLRNARSAPERVMALLPQVSARLRLSRQPQVLVVPGVVTPMVWSLGKRSRLLLPEQLLPYVDDDQLSTLLAHEMAHVYRGDQWVRLLELLSTLLYWWHPVVWWAQRNLRRAEEEACDAWVVWALPASAEAYARAIVTTVDFLSNDRTRLAPLATGIGDGPVLKQRLRNIVAANTPHRFSARARLLIVCLAAILLPLGLIGRGNQTEQPQGDAVSDDQSPAEAEAEPTATLLGFLRLTDDHVQSWAPDGTAADLPDVDRTRLQPGATVAVFRIPEDRTVQGYFLKASYMLEFPEVWRSSDDRTVVFCRMDLPLDRQFGNLYLDLRHPGERQHVFPLTRADAGQQVPVDTFGIESFSGLQETGAGAFRVTIHHSDEVRAERLAAVDTADRLVRPSGVQEASSGGSALLTFDFPLERLTGIALTKLEYEGLRYSNVALQPGVTAAPHFGQDRLPVHDAPAQPDPNVPDAHRAELPNGVLVELLGVGRFADGHVQWWSPDGSAQDAVAGVFEADVEGNGTVIAARIVGERATWLPEQEVNGDRRRVDKSAFTHPAGIWLAHVDPASNLETGNLILSITGGPARILETVPVDDAGERPDEPRIIEKITSVESTGPESCEVRFRFGSFPPGGDFAAIDQKGTIVESTGAGYFGRSGCSLSVPIAREQLKALAVRQQARYEVRFDDVALQPGQTTQVTQATRALSGEAPSPTPRPAPPAEVVVTGTVTDAETGEAINDYRLIPGYDYRGTGNMFFEKQNARSFNKSAFLFRIVPPNFSGPTEVVQYLRVEAPGYAAKIAPIDPELTPVVIEFQLRRDDGIPGVVQNPDGEPVPDAQVVVCLKTRWTQINDNRVRSGNPNIVAVTPDESGRFLVSRDDPAYAVLAIHDSGYGLVSLTDLEEHGKLVLQPWASLSGVFRIGDKPAANETIELDLWPMAELSRVSRSGIQLKYEAETDNQGRFQFPRVAGFEGRIGRRLVLRQGNGESMYTFAPGKNIVVEPGEALSFNFGGVGRAITGRLVARESYTEPIDFAWASGDVRLQQETPYPPGLTTDEQRRWYEEWKTQPEGRAHWLQAHIAGFKVNPDGSFRVDDLPPGKYQLMCRVEHPSADGRLRPSTDLGVYSDEITVPVGNAHEVIDLGDLELRINDRGDE